ncbi:hypothetical protein ACFQL4_10595 [Halosimplex aquaticum]
MTHRKRDALAVFGTGALLGLIALANYAVNRPGTFGLNYRVYHVAAEAALAGEHFYAATPPNSGFHYLYPPATVLAFLLRALRELGARVRRDDARLRAGVGRRDPVPRGLRRVAGLFRRPRGARCCSPSCWRPRTRRRRSPTGR